MAQNQKRDANGRFVRMKPDWESIAKEWKAKYLQCSIEKENLKEQFERLNEGFKDLVYYNNHHIFVNRKVVKSINTNLWKDLEVLRTKQQTADVK